MMAHPMAQRSATPIGDIPMLSTSEIVWFIACYKTEACELTHKEQNGKSLEACPFYHRPKERRRNPLLHQYSTVPCPYVNKSQKVVISAWAHEDPNVLCPRGEQCAFAHSYGEVWYHPRTYKTKMCERFCSSCKFYTRCKHAHALLERRNAGLSADEKRATGDAAMPLHMSPLPEVNFAILASQTRTSSCANQVKDKETRGKGSSRKKTPKKTQSEKRQEHSDKNSKSKAKAKRAFDVEESSGESASDSCGSSERVRTKRKSEPRKSKSRENSRLLHETRSAGRSTKEGRMPKQTRAATHNKHRSKNSSLTDHDSTDSSDSGAETKSEDDDSCRSHHRRRRRRVSGDKRRAKTKSSRGRARTGKAKSAQRHRGSDDGDASSQSESDDGGSEEDHSLSRRRWIRRRHLRRRRRRRSLPRSVSPISSLSPVRERRSQRRRRRRRDSCDRESREHFETRDRRVEGEISMNRMPAERTRRIEPRQAQKLRGDHQNDFYADGYPLSKSRSYLRHLASGSGYMTEQIRDPRDGKPSRLRRHTVPAPWADREYDINASHNLNQPPRAVPSSPPIVPSPMSRSHEPLSTQKPVSSPSEAYSTPSPPDTCSSRAPSPTRRLRSPSVASDMWSTRPYYPKEYPVTHMHFNGYYEPGWADDIEVDRGHVARQPRRRTDELPGANSAAWSKRKHMSPVTHANTLRSQLTSFCEPVGSEGASSQPNHSNNDNTSSGASILVADKHGFLANTVERKSYNPTLTCDALRDHDRLVKLDEQKTRPLPVAAPPESVDYLTGSRAREDFVNDTTSILQPATSSPAIVSRTVVSAFVETKEIQRASIGSTDRDAASGHMSRIASSPNGRSYPDRHREEGRISPSANAEDNCSDPQSATGSVKAQNKTEMAQQLAELREKIRTLELQIQRGRVSQERPVDA